jgi:fluoride exporter
LKTSGSRRGDGVKGPPDRAQGSPRQTAWRPLVRDFLFQLLRHKMIMLMVGGAVGTVLRYWIGRWFNQQPWGRDLPYGTLFINVTGSFILGFAAVVILERLPPEHQGWYLLIGTGFCGGYTTFSTFEWETFRLIRDGSLLPALYNVFVSVFFGFIAVVLAVALANAIFSRG